MPFKKHGRQYDLVLFGATGYTGKYTAEHITTNLPTNLKWAIAGRSRAKLEKLAASLKALNLDRPIPKIEVCDLSEQEVRALADKTFLFIATIGPYGAYGEHAFKACAEAGTHYVDVTGEVPFVARMIRKYESTAVSSGALIFPQCGIESAGADLSTWALARTIRSHFTDADVGEVTVCLHIQGAPSGGTLASVLSTFDNFTLAEFHHAHAPFSLSPVARPSDAPRFPKPSLLQKLTGLVRQPILGQMTTSIAARLDQPIIERTWGLLATVPTRKAQAYGPNFRFREYMRAKDKIQGIMVHWGVIFMGLVMLAKPLRALAKRLVTYQPGEGRSRDEAANEEVEYRGIAVPDFQGKGVVDKLAYSRAWYKGSLYYFTGVLASQAALTLLEEDVNLPGGIYTPACLGQGYVDRLDRVGFHIQTELVSV